MPEAVADLLREVLPYTIGVFAPPDWDRRYSECFGFTLEEIYEEGARSFESKLRAAGLPVEDLPGPLLYPIDLPPRERALRGMALLQSGILGEKNGPPARDPETMALLFDTVRRGVDFRTAPAGPLTVQWDFTDADAVAPAARQRLDRGGAGAGRGAGHRVPRALRGLRRRRRRAARPAAGDGDRAAAAARLAAHAVVGARHLFAGLVRRAAAARGGDGDALRAGRRADVRHLHAAVLEDGQRAEAAEQALGRDDERAVAGGQARAGGDRADRALEHELARGILDRAQAELGGQRGGELLRR